MAYADLHVPDVVRPSQQMLAEEVDLGVVEGLVGTAVVVLAVAVAPLSLKRHALETGHAPIVTMFALPAGATQHNCCKAAPN